MRAVCGPVPRGKGGALRHLRCDGDVTAVARKPGVTAGRRMRTSSVGPRARLLFPVRSPVAMLCRRCAGCLRSLPTLRLRARVLQPGWSSSRLPALPVCAAASVSAAAPGGWYEALAASAPVRAAEEVLLGGQAATGLPWWGSIVLTTVALRGAVTLPLAAYQHYILAKVRTIGPRAAFLLVLTVEAGTLLKWYCIC